jgi:hypothetical protein
MSQATTKQYWVTRTGAMYVAEPPTGSYSCAVGAVCMEHSTQRVGHHIDMVDYERKVYRCRPDFQGHVPNADVHEHPITDLAIKVSDDGKALVQLTYPHTRYEGRERTIQ